MGKLYTILFKVPELNKKILMTAMFLAIYRLGFYVPLPIVDQAKLKSWQDVQQQSAAGKVFGTVAMFGGAQIGMSTIFGLGIMPYISASIIFQLLGSIIPSLEAMMKEGESGRKKINEYTRYATVILCAVQSAFWVQYMMSPQMGVVLPQYQTFWHGMVSVCMMTAGTIFLMWIGEQIDEYGIGNGISLLIMAGILARMPVAMRDLLSNSTLSISPPTGKYGIVTLIVLAALFIGLAIRLLEYLVGRRIVDPRVVRRFSEAELRLHGLLCRLDLFLLLFLDRDHVQSQGHGREPQGLRQLHPWLPTRPTHRGLS